MQSKESFIHQDDTLPYYIHILFIHCLLLLAEILLILKITLQLFLAKAAS